MSIKTHDFWYTFYFYWSIMYILHALMTWHMRAHMHACAHTLSSLSYFPAVYWKVPEEATLQQEVCFLKPNVSAQKKKNNFKERGDPKSWDKRGTGEPMTYCSRWQKKSTNGVMSEGHRRWLSPAKLEKMSTYYGF